MCWYYDQFEKLFLNPLFQNTEIKRDTEIISKRILYKLLDPEYYVKMTQSV